MNSLERAKKFLASKAAKIALTAVPLAVAVPAALGQGPSLILNYSSGCSVNVGSGSCSLSGSQSSGGNPNVNYLSMASSGSLYPASGSLSLSSNEGASGTVTNGEIIPIAWDFSVYEDVEQGLATTTSGGTVNGNLSVTLNGTGFSGSYSQNFGGPITVGSTVSGSGNLVISGSGSVTTWRISLDFTPGSTSSYNVDIPGGSTIDVNPLSSATPEPATFVLTGAGLLGLLQGWRKRKKV